MTKKTFLTKLKSKLNILEEQGINDIIDEYSSHIDSKIEQGKSEKEAVADFGDIDELVKKILSAYKIKPTSENTESKFEQVVNDVIDGMVNFFKALFENVSDQKVSKILVTILYIIIALMLASVLLWFVRIPFDIIEDIGLSLINVGGDNILTDAFSLIWRIFVGVSLFVVSLVVLFAIVKKVVKYFQNEDVKISKEVKKDTKVITNEIKQEVKSSKERDSLLDLLMIFTKIFVVIFVYIPLIGTDIGFAVSLGAIIFFMVKGIISVGLLLLFIGMLIISVSLTVLVTKFLFSKGGVR